MATLTIEITDVSAAMLAALAARTEELQTGSLEGYVRLLIQQDIQPSTHFPDAADVTSGQFRRLLDCIQQQVQESNLTEQELDALFAQARREAKQTKLRSVPAPALGEDHPLAKVAGSMGGETWREIMAEMKHEREQEEAHFHSETMEANGVPS